MMGRSLFWLAVVILSAVSYCPRAFGAVETEPPSPAEDGTLRALTCIAGEGMMDSHAYDYLEELSDRIGGRVTGSPQAARAIEWGMEKMKAIGLDNVRAEHWQMSKGWTRVVAGAELLSPITRRLMVDSLGWVGSTPQGGVEAEVVTVNGYQLDGEMKNNASKWAGKVLLMVHKGASQGAPGRVCQVCDFPEGCP